MSEQLLTLIADRTLEIQQDVAEIKGRFMAMDARMTLVERRVDRLENRADDTGKHDLARVEKQLEKEKDGGSHWVRWAVQTVVTVVISVVGALLATHVGK